MIAKLGTSFLMGATASLMSVAVLSYTHEYPQYIAKIIEDATWWVFWVISYAAQIVRGDKK